MLQLHLTVRSVYIFKRFSNTRGEPFSNSVEDRLANDVSTQQSLHTLQSVHIQNPTSTKNQSSQHLEVG